MDEELPDNDKESDEFTELDEDSAPDECYNFHPCDLNSGSAYEAQIFKHRGIRLSEQSAETFFIDPFNVTEMDVSQVPAMFEKEPESNDPSENEVVARLCFIQVLDKPTEAQWKDIFYFPLFFRQPPLTFADGKPVVGPRL